MLHWATLTVTGCKGRPVKKRQKDNLSFFCFFFFSTDIFVVDDKTNSVSVYLWNPDQWTFDKEPVATVEMTSHVVGVAINDLDYDGRMDMIVTTKNTNDLTLNFYYHDDILSGNLNFKMDGFLDQVLLFDYNGDMRTDILGTTADGTVCLVYNNSDYIP